MSPKLRNSGHAIALLLWMIAGMSLMVTAVIHLARDDISMAELRLNEAKTRAAARALAFLAARDSALQGFSPARADGAMTGGSSGQAVSDEDQDEQTRVFTKQYNVEGVAGTVTLLPASAYVSLNSSSEQEMFTLLVGLGGADSTEAYEMVQGVLAYRSQGGAAGRSGSDFSGFRFREELMAVPGMTRDIYDRVKDFVHTHMTSGLNTSQAPDSLAAVFSDGFDEGSVGADARGSDARAARDPNAPAKLVQGPLTFESIYRHKAVMARGSAVNAAVVDVTLPNGYAATLRVWINQAGSRVLRVEPMNPSALES